MILKSQPPTVLHVTESFGGGVASALAQYVLSTPELEHHLLMGEREGDFTDSGELALFQSVGLLSKNPIAALRQIRRHCKRLQPNVIHAHSSFAGAYVRIAKMANRERPLVYTPHGYAFERKDIAEIRKYSYKLVERLLAFNTSVTAACSPRELELAKAVRSKRTVYVPNIAGDPPPSSGAGKQTASIPAAGQVIASVGRITAARDPLFFLETVRILRDQKTPLDAVWIGGGDDHYVQALQDVGVRVTGWLNRKQALAELSKANLHIHTASWDAFPMVLLEANAQRIPSLVRPIDAFSHFPKEITASTPSELAERIKPLLSEPSKRMTLLEAWDRALSENTRDVQRLRLREAYSL